MLDGQFRALGIPETGYNDDFGRRRTRPEIGYHIQPGTIGQANVEEYNVKIAVLHPRQAVLERVCDRNTMPCPLDVRCQHAAEPGVIVKDEYFRHPHPLRSLFVSL